MSGTTWTPPPPPGAAPATGVSLKDRMAALNAASGGAGLNGAKAAGSNGNGSGSNGLRAKLDEADDDEDLDGDFSDLTGGLSAAKLGGAPGGAKPDQKSAALTLDGELSEGDAVSSGSDADVKLAASTVINKATLPNLSDKDDDDIDLREVHAALIPGSAPPPAGGSFDPTYEMGEGERAIFGAEDYEPDLVEFAEPETKHGSVSGYDGGVSGLSPAGRKAGSVLNPRGSALTKCSDPRCMAFAARGAYCLRHVYQEKKTGPVSEQQSRLQYSFDELVAGEDKYNKALYSALHHFHDRLRALVKLDKPLLTASEIDRIFLNLNELLRVSDDLLADLRDLKSRKRLHTHTGAVFLHYTQLFEVYRKYCSGNAAALQALNQTKDRSIAFRQFIELNERCEGASLESLLSVPNIALMRYMQALEEIKGLIPADSVMKPDLQGAYSRIADLSAAIDAATGITQAHKQVQLIADQFERDDKYQDVVAAHRTFVRSGQLKKKYNKTAKHAAGTKVYTFFLFSDVLVLAALTKTKRYKMKQFVTLGTVAVKPTPGPKREENEFELKTERKKAFTVIATSTRERDDWVTAISSRIADTRKNPPPNSPIGLRGVEGDDGNDGFSLGKASTGAKALSAAADDFSSPGPSANFKPIGGLGSGSGSGSSGVRGSDAAQQKTGEPVSPKQSSGSVAVPNANISEAAARLGIVEEADTDPEANVMFTSETFEPPNAKPQSLYIVI